MNSIRRSAREFWLTEIPGIRHAGSIRQEVPAGAITQPSPSLCCPTSYKELNSFHFAFHLQLPKKFSRVFAVQLRSEQGMPRGSAGIWAYLLICHCEHTSFRAPFKTKPASNSQHNTFSSALQKHFAWQQIPKQFVYLKGDIQVGFGRNDSEDDWKKLKEYLKTPAWGSPLTSKRRKLKPCKRL